MTEKMSSRPPLTKELDTLISAAEQPKRNDYATSINFDSLPWLKINVRDDVSKTMTLHLQESHMMKLKYLKEHLPNISKHKFVRKAVERAIDEAIEELIKK